jgi:hypothetical protein
MTLSYTVHTLRRGGEAQAEAVEDIEDESED